MTFGEIYYETIDKGVPKALGKPAIYEGLAEELTEAAHAALKVSRILRGDNPTPVTLEDAEMMLEEEIMDVWIYLYMTNVEVNAAVVENKILRLNERLRAKGAII